MRNRGKYMRNFPLRFFEKKADIFTLLRPYTSTQNAKISQENLREILNENSKHFAFYIPFECQWEEGGSKKRQKNFRMQY